MRDSIVYQEKIPSLGSLIFRYPTPSDAEAMCDYINDLSQEETFVTFQGERIELESERTFVQNEVERIEKKQSIMLLAFLDQELIGVSSVTLKDRISRHEGILGISISKKYRGKKLGRKFLSCLLEEAKQHLLNLKIITLEAFSINTVALNLYESFGFQEFGRLPKGIYYKSRYIDHVYMYKEV